MIPVFYGSIVIGILFLVAVFAVDDVYDGMVPALGALFVAFGAFGLISLSSSDGDVEGTFLMLCGLGALAFAAATFVGFRFLRRGAERSSEPLTVGDLVSSKGNVLWWRGDAGEVSLVVRGEKRTVRARSLDALRAGDAVIVVRASSVSDVDVVAG